MRKIVYDEFFLIDVDDSFMSSSKILHAFVIVSHQRKNDVDHIWPSFEFVL